MLLRESGSITVDGVLSKITKLAQVWLDDTFRSPQIQPKEGSIAIETSSAFAFP